jgi:hypothetical protein
VRNFALSSILSALRPVAIPREDAKRRVRVAPLNTLLCRRALGAFNYFVDRGRELVDSRAWHDDGVAPAMRFLGDPQEPAPLIFPELDVEVLALDL